MFNLTTTVRSPFQAIAMLLAVALVMWSIGFYSTAQAFNLANLENLLSDSAPDATGVTHTFSFTVPTNSVGNTTEVDIVFPTAPATWSIAGANLVSVSVDSVAAGSPSLSPSGQTLTISGFTAVADEEVEIVVDGLDNPGTTGSYVFSLNTDVGDDGDTRVMIVDTVDVTAAIETTFEFIISGVATGTTVRGTEDTTGSTTATLIDFGVLTANTDYLLAQQLNVTTNAGNGFRVTVESDSNGNLISDTGADINTFFDGTDVTTPTAWQDPDNDVNNSDTWGHWGLTSNDTTLGSSGNPGAAFGAEEFIAVQGTPQVVMAHFGPADGIAQDIGEAIVAYRIRVTPLQEAANDYRTTLTYIATPTF